MGDMNKGLIILFCLVLFLIPACGSDEKEAEEERAGDVKAECIALCWNDYDSTETTCGASSLSCFEACDESLDECKSECDQQQEAESDELAECYLGCEEDWAGCANECNDSYNACIGGAEEELETCLNTCEETY